MMTFRDALIAGLEDQRGFINEWDLEAATVEVNKALMSTDIVIADLRRGAFDVNLLTQLKTLITNDATAGEKLVAFIRALGPGNSYADVDAFLRDAVADIRPWMAAGAPVH